MDSKFIDPSIEVSGVYLGAIVNGFHGYLPVALKYLTAQGLVSEGKNVDRSAWYSLAAWLHAFDAIQKELGQNVLFGVGESLAKSANLPISAVEIDAAMRSIDITYHTNHRKHGVVMFKPATGAMLEWIGHYGYARHDSERKITMVCDNPYTCSFDQGLLAAMARRFEPHALINHEDQRPCRARGGPACTYTVTW